MAVPFLVVRCASGPTGGPPTSHLPSSFTPFFPDRPSTQFQANYLFEIQALEAAPELSLLGKKRLLDLYRLESKQLKGSTGRALYVQGSIERLERDVTVLEAELRGVEEENKKQKDPVSEEPKPTQLTTPALRNAYQTAYKLWNKDRNDEALSRLDKSVADKNLQSQAKEGEWRRLLNLRFRIALEVGEFEKAEEAYVALRGDEKCSTEAAQAGFLLALRAIASGQAAPARRIFDDQCDPDQSPSNRIKRAYWDGRIAELEGKATSEAYKELLSGRVPGYYLYLAKLRLQQPIDLPTSAFQQPSYLTQPLVIDAETSRAIESAETRIRANLRRDATVYLQSAARTLRQGLGKHTVDANQLRGLLYVAHLFEAAGAPLEAMRIYTVVTTELLDEQRAAIKGFPLDFLPEMFPRPHGPIVESLSRRWVVDPDFIYAIMRQESAFNPAAMSMANARGLMQLLPSLAKSLSHQWSYHSYYADRLLFVADENLKYSVYHLHQLFSMAPHPALVAGAYNAGFSRMLGWWRRHGSLPLDIFVEFVPVNETRNYIKLVLRNMLYYRGLRAGGGTVDPNCVPLVLPPAPGSANALAFPELQFFSPDAPAPKPRRRAKLR